MSVRVVARVRPLLKQELEKDIIVQAACEGSAETSTVVRLPNPKNEAELFSYHFNSVYDQDVTQKQMFDKEVAPTIKHLFNGFDITLFAYGVTGTGKTHTMRGGKSLADRGVIPRLLSGVYRKAKKIETDSDGATQVQVAMSYYEIYNDRVYDLFETPEKRTATGLPIRDNGGKTIVCGLTERPCTTLKDFEKLYDEANVNRSTSATKLNAHSSRSHAILCVKLTQTSETKCTVSTASAIDLAGSEDNRRTENNKDRMVESASINKSLFVLAQCVEAIGKKQSRIPYRESKMTRILSLGQNNGFTVMILNLAPMRSYHLDTISSLNLASRTKKIEVNEVENEPIFKTSLGASKITASALGSNLNRQPLRPLTSTNSSNCPPSSAKSGKPMKSFSVYADNKADKATMQVRISTLSTQIRKPDPRKRPLDTTTTTTISQTSKMMRPLGPTRFHVSRSGGMDPSLSKASIEQMIEKRIEAELAKRDRQQNEHNPPQLTLPASLPPDLQSRLDRLEQRIDNANADDDERAEGLHYLLMAKQHQLRGEDASALKMYQLAAPYFPNNERLPRKMAKLQEKIRARREEAELLPQTATTTAPFAEPDDATVPAARPKKQRVKKRRDNDDDDDVEDGDYFDEDEGADSDAAKPKRRSKPKHSSSSSSSAPPQQQHQMTPRTAQLLTIINSRDVSQIKLLKGVGLKKAEGIVACLEEREDGVDVGGVEELVGTLRGVGAKGVMNMREGLGVGGEVAAAVM